MLSREDNELISRVGPGTPMGNLMRQYWLPAMVSAELPEVDGAPLRVRLLGENLIAFRSSTGQVGLLQNHCPHRGASLFFGRNEEAGLRCVYHGWKFAIDGTCVDMPNEPAESDFRTKVQAVAYPCVERGGVVWTYMGPRAEPPPLPDLEPNMRTDMELSVYVSQQDCNWLQVLEGDIDTVHAGFLHSGSITPEERQPGSHTQYMVKDRTARFEVVDAEGGALTGAYRAGPPGMTYWRLAYFLFPVYDMPAPGLLGHKIGCICRVPMDDEHTLSFFMNADVPGTARGSRDFGNPTQPNTSDWLGRFRTVAGPHNDFTLDRAIQRANKGRYGYTGIPGGAPMQDAAVTWSMGPIFDRSQERLGSTDTMIIRTRRRLLAAAQALAERGTIPPGVDTPEVYRVRSGGVFLPEDAHWLDATAHLRQAFVDHPDLDPSIVGPL
ncbi:MAG TPA: Rieske 2Fe-2S domain-containing protein [Chloroflexota bacterium]|nr:Rieske 2Fe-2S domain-containing protein [Chloroflexota bacterium]